MLTNKVRYIRFSGSSISSETPKGGWTSRCAAIAIAALAGWIWLGAAPRVVGQDNTATPPVVAKDDGQSDNLPTPVRAYNRLLKSTVYVQFLVQEPEGTVRYRGTGWVIDRERRLVITNQHVVMDQAEVSVWCPAYENGELVGMLDHYFNKVRPIRAVVIDRDPRRDLALLQLDRLPDDIIALPLASKSPSPGEKVFSLGAWPVGSEGMWIFTAGEVRSVYQRRHANDYVCRVVETQLPTNQGNSGGPVINDKGELVAVVEGHHTEARLVSLYIAVEEVSAYMEELKDLIDPQTADAFYNRGDRRYFEGQFRQAAADYTSCLRLDSGRMDALLSRGWCQFRLGDYQTALTDFEDAIKRDPENAEGHAGRARCFSKLSRITEARDGFTEAIRREPGKEIYYYWRGELNYILDDYQAALSDLNEAVRLSPDDVDNRILRSKIHRLLGNHEAAMNDGRKAVELDDEDYRGYQQCAIVLRASGELERAIVVYGGAIELAPNEWELYLGRGSCYHENGQTEPAINDFVKSIELNEKNPYSYWGLGLIMRDLQEWERAIAFFTRCIELDPNDPDYYEQRAACYDASGNAQAATQDRNTYNRLKK